MFPSVAKRMLKRIASASAQSRGIILAQHSKPCIREATESAVASPPMRHRRGGQEHLSVKECVSWGSQTGFQHKVQETGPSDVRFLVTGALGQIGLELVPYMRSRFGAEAVIASDVKAPGVQTGPFRHADVMDVEALANIIHEERVTCVIHLASILSASGEKNPSLALEININSIQTVLELSRKLRLRVFAPSTIAVFRPSTPKDSTPNTTIMDPSTIYGITKVHLELLGQYYRKTHGVDFRSLRFPGIVSAHSMPGGGTTDYAVDIFHSALNSGSYACYLNSDQALPMMYMPDCLKGTVDYIMARPESLSKSVYNIAAMSFSPQDITMAIQRHLPFFRTTYHPDFRQNIASTWPRSIDDSLARRDWGWNPSFGLEAMTADMLHHLGPRYKFHEESAVAATG